MEKLPLVSIIIPAYNEEKRLPKALKSLKTQTYPQNKLQVILVDDNSTDNTVKIAKEFGATVIVNGSKNIEKGKSLGIKESTGELLFFMDADNYLPNNNWLVETVTAFINETGALGAEAIYFQYEKNRPAADRYCQLFGINDPFPYYLKRQDRLEYGKKQWNLAGEVIKETKNYYLLKFNLHNLPTVGSQGYLMKKSDILTTNWQPFFFHMDTHTEILAKQPKEFVMMKLSVGHQHCENIASFLKKVSRNGRLFLMQNHQRSYQYGSGKNEGFKAIIIAGIKCLTIIVPAKDTLRGYMRHKDLAWFLHIPLCFATAIIYGSLFLRWKLGLLK